jgi:exonuclease III
MTTISIATLNINGITSSTRTQMLRSFIYKQDLDILLLQEVTHPCCENLAGYATYYNIGSTQRGTAIVARDNIVLNSITKIPSGRAIAAKFQDTWIINVYAPSGAVKRDERERFFNVDLTYLLRTETDKIIIGGDFNCVLNKTDITGQYNHSRTLELLTTGLALRDAWENKSTKAYTHYSPTGASRLDRFYISHPLYKNKSSILTVPAAFTDHFAVILRLKIDSLNPRRGRGLWKMKPAIMASTECKQQLQQRWLYWTRLKQYYTNIGQWWERAIKKKIQKFYKQKESESNRDKKQMENHFYECLYEILAQTIPEKEKRPRINKMKANIVKLHSETLKTTIMTDIDTNDRIDDETPSLYHIVQARKRRTQRTIQCIEDGQGIVHHTPREILNVFAKHYTHKYGTIDINEGSMQCMLNAIHPITLDLQTPLDDQPISMDEIQRALRRGIQKAPGPDGIVSAFYIENWDVIKQDLCDVVHYAVTQETTETTLNQGTIVCIPKTKATNTPTGYRPITLFNTDYKIIARTLAQRLRPLMEELRETQYCGVPNNNIFDAVNTVREAIAHAEITGTPLCVISLDFQEAFDKISHTYLFTLLEKYAINGYIRTGIKNLYSHATSIVQVNGYTSDPIPIHGAIRQGCPLSMQLYALALHPLLTLLNQTVNRLQIGRSGRNSAVVAYADDITLFVTSPNDLPIIWDIIQTFERATGAQLNRQKSKALAIAGWRTNNKIGIDYAPQIKILGVTFTSTIARSTQLSWDPVNNTIREQARASYARKLCIAQRIQYVTTTLLAKIWYMAQILPPAKENTNRITTAILWYIWQGSIFRVPTATLQNNKNQGGWDLINIAAKCNALLINRIWIQYNKSNSATAALLQQLNLTTPIANPPRHKKELQHLQYLQIYAREMAYIRPQEQHETTKIFRKRVYRTLHEMERAAGTNNELRIIRHWPNTNWANVWTNLHSSRLSDNIKSAWYKVIHELIPTKERLVAINLASSMQCDRCHKTDTLTHRLTNCDPSAVIWQWTKNRIATILRYNQQYIPPEWILRPQFQFWPPQRHNAIVWIIGHLVWYLTNEHRLSLTDYIDFLRRARWKIINTQQSRRTMGKYLEIL